MEKKQTNRSHINFNTWLKESEILTFIDQARMWLDLHVVHLKKRA